jgi:steroid 5-alpha reductase family enzyme
MGVLQFILTAVAASAALCVIMAAAWRLQQASGKSGWVDSIWTFGVGAVSAVTAMVPVAASTGSPARQVVVATLCTTWSLRLGSHVVARNRRTGDDPRYRHLAEEWGSDAPRRMFWFLQSQAAVGVIFVLAVALAAHNPHPAWRIQDGIGVAVALGAILGEAIADRQLRRFASSPANRNAVCDVGLWRWSRHPNYFCEWLHWCAYPIFAIGPLGGNTLGWLSLGAPLCMYWLLVHVSGIPPLEQHMEQTRGEAFRAYSRRTSAFFPWPSSA